MQNDLQVTQAIPYCRRR